MENSEMFLGGFAGGFLARGLTHIGYGSYFTTSRLIGIDLGANGGGALGGTLAGFIHGELMPKLSSEESAKTITDLERMKEFEIEKGPDKPNRTQETGHTGNRTHRNYTEGRKTGEDNSPAQDSLR